MPSDLKIIINANELITAESELPKRGKELSCLKIIKNGAIVFNDRIIEVGESSSLIRKYKSAKKIDALNKIVIPGFIDSHTHLVYFGSREKEYEAKIMGKTYTELHEKYGINFTVDKTRAATDKELIEHAINDMNIMLLYGTTTIEAKSGYGLNEKDEIRILKIMKKLNSMHPIDIIPTFLGAHTLPYEFKNKRKKYIELVIKLIPKLKGLAKFCDVWCDELGFSIEETEKIFEVANNYGLKLKIHVEQTSYMGIEKLNPKFKLISADHLDYISHSGIKSLINRDAIGVLLPGVTYHLMEFNKNIPVRKMINENLPIAISTDYNPGSSKTQSMLTIIQLASRLYRMSYAEVLNAATINAAFAVDKGNEIGSLVKGKKADIVICSVPTHGILIENFGINHVDTVIKNGNIVVKDGRLRNTI